MNIAEAIRQAGTTRKSKNLVVLWVVDVDGLGGLTAVEMVKYAVSDDGKNGQI